VYGAGLIISISHFLYSCFLPLGNSSTRKKLARKPDGNLKFKEESSCDGIFPPYWLATNRGEASILTQQLFPSDSALISTPSFCLTCLDHYVQLSITAPLSTLHSFRPMQVCAQTPGVVVSFMFRFKFTIMIEYPSLRSWSLPNSRYMHALTLGFDVRRPCVVV
jgi:hypothetical protein